MCCTGRRDRMDTLAWRKKIKIMDLLFFFILHLPNSYPQIPLNMFVWITYTSFSFISEGSSFFFTVFFDWSFSFLCKRENNCTLTWVRHLKLFWSYKDIIDHIKQFSNSSFPSNKSNSNKSLSTEQDKEFQLVTIVSIVAIIYIIFNSGVNSWR